MNWIINFILICICLMISIVCDILTLVIVCINTKVVSYINDKSTTECVLNSFSE